MNVKQLTALLLLSASAGAVLADTDTPLNPPSGFSRTRAEVAAELRQPDAQPWLASGDGDYPRLPVSSSVKSRQQVQAELAAASGGLVFNSLYRGS
jgi:hypothetical protein